MQTTADVSIWWKEDSKFLSKSEVQAAAVQTLGAALTNGSSAIGVLPCGSGKSAVMAELAFLFGTMCLFLTYEKVGVAQLTEMLLSHTTLTAKEVCCVTSASKVKPNPRRCYLVMSYAMLSSIIVSKRGRNSTIAEFIKGTSFDLVVCDECHHICAETYAPAIEYIKTKTRRCLGMTATLFRSECAQVESRKAHEQRVFGWFGRVKFRKTSAELEQLGLVAKTRRRVVFTPFVREFALAYEQAEGSMRTNVQAVHPGKLNALIQIVAMHSAVGHMGIVFANHLFASKERLRPSIQPISQCATNPHKPPQVLLRILGPRWKALSGSSAHGDDDKHTAEQNAKIVAEFNAGELDGIVSTSVGESAADFHNPRFVYIVIVDAHGGNASAAQRDGRLARTPRVERSTVEGAEGAEGAESDASLLRRRLAVQKSAFLYDLVTPQTEVCNSRATPLASHLHPLV